MFMPRQNKPVARRAATKSVGKTVEASGCCIKIHTPLGDVCVLDLPICP